jgi:hypothetical protein
MPKKRTQKIYFGVPQEKAVVNFLKTETEEEKNKIFNEYLREPLIKMVESIIRRYKLYRKGMEFQEQVTDTMSFLFTKVDKFNPNANHKAYSYFGTICKNYLMGSIQKDNKELIRTLSYEDISSDIEENLDFSYRIDETPIDHKDMIIKIKDKIELIIEKNNLSDNEKKLGYALVDIFNNFEQIFDIGEGNKFNKNLILFSIREMTSMNTKEIRSSMKKYKTIYSNVVFDFLN